MMKKKNKILEHQNAYSLVILSNIIRNNPELKKDKTFNWLLEKLITNFGIKRDEFVYANSINTETLQTYGDTEILLISNSLLQSNIEEFVQEYYQDINNHYLQNSVKNRISPTSDLETVLTIIMNEAGRNNSSAYRVSLERKQQKYEELE